MRLGYKATDLNVAKHIGRFKLEAHKCRAIESYICQ